MTAATLTIRPFPFRDAGEAAYAAENDHYNLIRAEWFPGEPPRSLARAIAYWQSTPAFIDVWVWHAFAPDGQLVASSELSLERAADNQHLAEFNVDVAPAWRRQGLARRLLQLVARQAQAEGRTLLLGRTSARLPTGEAVMRRLGATPGQTVGVSQLDLERLDWERLQAWTAGAPPGYYLDFYESPYPEEMLAAIAAYRSMMMSEEPHGDLDVEPFVMTVEELREMQRFVHGTHRRLWIALARERATGAAGGGTELIVDPEQPQLVQQMGTAVYPHARCQGLGRWLKAAMLHKLRADWPAARFVRTGNATTNAAMLAINAELGFRPVHGETTWQLPTERLLAYVQG